MKTVFADTFFFLAAVNRSDPLHREALRVYARADHEFVTTTWVLTELADALANREERSAFVRSLRLVQRDPKFRIVPATQRLFERGVELYAQRPDKDWSLTDCISFVVMGDEKMTDAATGDRHFEQAGFTILLK
ncbi:MAG: type II toxin-antitoxin system VapC family toxin [Planctomycetes bacterium]|nr:type II toxin-antitoxin system VapC family toxin [Planctomycetota bacterium]MBM4078964.1 type II toxin-antitoxin system VapC family toxin [Planctomycetota bacterium]MBM4083798.1 type II toxin-antitoxin system VapC family toxin [Planctomycetota bacterium]